MTLSDRDIISRLDEGVLEIEPLNREEQIQPCSVDLRLGSKVSDFAIDNDRPIDPKNHAEEDLMEEREIGPGGLTVGPDDFYCVNTIERVSLPATLKGEIEGRSSIGRIGIEVHSTAGIVDPGWDGELVLEISNNTRHAVKLYPGMRVAQLLVEQVSRRCENPYGEKQNSKYQGQRGATGSRIAEDFISR